MAKIKVRSYVAVRPPQDSTGLSVGFTQNIQRTNRIGASLTNIGEQLGTFNTLLEFQTEHLVDKGKESTSFIERTSKTELERRRELRRDKRKDKGREVDDAAEAQVEAEPTKEDQEAIKEKVKKEKGGRLKGFLSIFKGIGNLLMPLLAKLGLFAALDWIAKNPEKVQNMINFITGWVKFGWKILSFGVNSLMDGVTKLFGGDPNESAGERIWEGVKGIGQMFIGLSAIWAASRVFFPWKLVKDFRRLKMLFDIFNPDTGEERDSRNADRNNRQRANKKRQQGRTRNASKDVRKRYQRRYGNDAAKRRFKGKVGGRGPMKKLTTKVSKMMKKFSGGLKKLGGAKGLTKLAKVGAGAMSIMSGLGAYQDALAEGKTNTEAIGRGVGTAAGGLAGAAIATALLGPFIGPLAPILGSIVGEWAGGWLGENLAPLVEKAFGHLFEWFKTAKEFLANNILKVIDFTLNTYYKPMLDWIVNFLDFIQPAMDYLKKFNDFVFSAQIDLIVKGIKKMIGGAKFIADKAGAAWNWLSAPFRAEGGPVMSGPTPNKNRAIINERSAHARRRKKEVQRLKEMASGGGIKSMYSTGSGGASKKLPMGSTISWGMLYPHHSGPGRVRSYGSHTVGLPMDYNFGNTKSGDPWPSAGKDVAVPTPLDSKVIYRDSTSTSGGYGNTALLQTSEGFIQYSHMHSLGNYKPGDTLKAGAIVGGQGDTGTPGSWHVHMNAPKKLHEMFLNYISLGKPTHGQASGTSPTQGEASPTAADATPTYSAFGGQITPENRNMGQKDSYFSGLDSATSGIQYAPNAALNKTGSISALSSASIAAGFDRQMSGSSAIVMLQQVNSQGQRIASMPVLVTRPNPSPMINRC
tara:strand:- start:7090 stop:9678 length:2589 start_codon:yes stop_codon:yes gene_type:complete